MYISHKLILCIRKLLCSKYDSMFVYHEYENASVYKRYCRRKCFQDVRILYAFITISRMGRSTTWVHFTKCLWAHNLNLAKLFLFRFRFWWCDEATLLCISIQHSCCGMCKIVPLSRRYFLCKSTTYFCKIWIWPQTLFVKWIPLIFIPKERILIKLS